MVKIAVYGTLRPGDYNYQRFVNLFGEWDFQVLTGPIEITGYRMYDLGSYPGIKKASDNDKIIVQVIGCSDECYDVINAMEEGAGYQAIDLKVDGHECKTFLYDHDVYEETLIPHGDWIKDVNDEKEAKNKSHTKVNDVF
jgi:gamma-glutamylcyclotransferase (GGCT)/AIG2-like uncharacterized protein YtfP